MEPSFSSAAHQRRPVYPIARGTELGNKVSHLDSRCEDEGILIFEERMRAISDAF